MTFVNPLRGHTDSEKGPRWIL